MMESSDLRNHYDAPAFWLLHGSRFRSIFGQRQMSSGVLVVGKITSQSPAQRSFIPHDDVVQAFPANGTDQPLHKRILPWRSRRGNHFLYPQAFRHFYPVIPVDRIAVAQKISAPLVPGETLPGSAASSNPGWGGRSPGSAAHDVEHAITPRRQTEPGRSPSALRRSRSRPSVLGDWSRRFAKSGKGACALGEDIWPPSIVLLRSLT
jgi:hypothetical protein